MRKTLAMILAGGRGGPLGVLSRERAKTAVPFAGKYRIIDFPLSNCSNSGIYKVGILAQYLPKSLSDHIKTGKPWDLDRLEEGIRILQPYVRKKANNWYRGTADALVQNLNFIKHSKSDTVLVISGDHIYMMDYKPLLDFHEENDSDLTIAVKKVSRSESYRFGMVTLKDDGIVEKFEEKPENSDTDFAFMGIYLFSKDFLMEKLKELEQKGKYCLVFDVLMEMLGKNRVFAYEYEGYWQDVGHIKPYYETNMELLSGVGKLDLYHENWGIHTRSEERPPVKFGLDANIDTSLISNGCIIEGGVINSILSPGVVVEKGARVKDSIIMTDTVIRSGAKVNQSILDKRVYVAENCEVGDGESKPNPKSPYLKEGVTLIGKGTHLPKNCHIGKNCEIGVGLQEKDFEKSNIPSGENLV